MPLKAYGVLKATVAERRQATRQSPHYELLCEAGGERWRIAINARSQLPPSEVAYAIVTPFAHPTLADLSALADGWRRLGQRGAGLDYVRGNLAQPDRFRPLPTAEDGPDNDLNDLFDHHLGRLIGDPGARLYAFGEPWGPESEPDEYFGFTPGRGVHDIHQNQGNVGRFVDDDGVWQDGGLVFSAGGEWTAILLRFQSQAWHTDDDTGHALEGEPTQDGAVLQIMAAVVNPPGPAPEAERVLLLNTGYAPIDLAGWRLVTRTGSAPIAGTVPATGTLELSVPASAPLSNKGGLISVLDPSGRKVHGVSYGADAAGREDRMIVF
jgi:uncharacterized protein YukJ